jgi:RNA polymerase sigma factor (sigma-70 family)
MVEIPKQEIRMVNECLKGNRMAQRELYEKYKTGMYTVAYRILGNSNDAHDALQEAFINVFSFLSGYGFRSSLGAWIKKIVVNCSLQQLNKNNRIEFQPVGLANEKAIVWSDNFTAEMLDQAIKSLPDKARVVFLLVEVEGYKHQEVAEMLNINEGTSKSQLFYAKTLLQKKLKDLKNND